MIYRGHNKGILSAFFQDLKSRGNKIVCVSGYFDPPHPDHLSYFREAKMLGDLLVVILNTDEQLLEKRKGTKLEGIIRYPFEDRVYIINEFKPIDIVVPCLDEDTSVAETLRAIAPHIFAKGGDRTLENLPQKEKDLAKECGYEIVCGVGHPKEHSSSWYDWEHDGMKLSSEGAVGYPGIEVRVLDK